MDTVDILEKRAEEMFSKVGNWQKNALRRIGRRVRDIGKLSYADLQAINNATIAGQDVNAIMEELAELTGQNVRDVQQIYAEMIEQQHEANRTLYDYRKKKFVPFAENKELQALVRAYSRTTAESFVGLTMSQAKNIGFVNDVGKFVPMESNFISILDRAVMSISTGTGTFHQEMRDAIMQLGGSGLRVDYGNGVTRSIDSMVRQNLLWGAKQASVEYNEMIGEELGCDGIEIDWHSNPRPQHEFMQGKQYALGKARTVNGTFFESADKALEALQDYGCLHFKTPIICGVSEPTYTPEELARLNAQNARQIEIDGVSKTGYEWKQTMRRLEREGRTTRLQRETLKAEGDVVGVKNLDAKMKLIEERYGMIAEKTGIKAQSEKMTIRKNTGKTVDFSAKSGIINTKISNHRVSNPMDRERYLRMRQGLLRNGITTLEAKGDDLGYLYSLGAEASYGHGYIMHVGETPSASAMFEEVIHARQAQIYGEFDGDNLVELCAREVPANRKLLKYKEAYGFDETDVEEITKNLKYWEEKFEREVGCSYDEGSYRREV